MKDGVPVLDGKPVVKNTEAILNSIIIYISSFTNHTVVRESVRDQEVNGSHSTCAKKL